MDGNFCDFTTFRIILATFYCACAETANSELAVTTMTTPLDSATPISRKRRKFRQSESVYVRFGPFSLSMRRIGIIYASGPKSAKFLSFWLKLWQCLWIQRPRFPITGGYFGNRTTYSVLFCTFYPEFRHISISGLLDLISWKVGHMLP